MGLANYIVNPGTEQPLSSRKSMVLDAPAYRNRERLADHLPGELFLTKYKVLELDQE